MWKSLGTKTYQGPTELNVKCAFVKNLKVYNQAISKERLVIGEEQRPSHRLIACSLFSYFFCYLLCVCVCFNFSATY